MKQQTIPKTARELRELFRHGEMVVPTAGLAPGYVQANLVVLPGELAFDFLLFCQRNPRPCPLLEVVEAGSAEPRTLAPGADLRTDVGLYRIYRNGKLAEEVKEIAGYWTRDMVSFLLGCSFTFEAAMIRAGIPLRHIEQGKNVSMYRTNIPCVQAGIFSGPMVVSMRPIHHSQVVKAVQVTSRFPFAHGAPLHIGSPEVIGVRDINRPEYGDPVEIKKDEVPVFWACGVTPQSVAVSSKPPLMLTHSPGYMFITDMPDEDLSVL